MADPAFGDHPRKLPLEPWCPTGIADFLPRTLCDIPPEGNGSSALAGGSAQHLANLLDWLR
jgi:hypothetical protein